MASCCRAWKRSWSTRRISCPKSRRSSWVQRRDAAVVRAHARRRRRSAARAADGRRRDPRSPHRSRLAARAGDSRGKALDHAAGRTALSRTSRGIAACIDDLTVRWRRSRATVVRVSPVLSRGSRHARRSCVQADFGRDDRAPALGRSGARHLALHYSPVDVAQVLAALMTAQTCAWILTSATLAVGEDFSHFKRRAGPHARGLRDESPFDFRRQALLYLPAGLADPGASTTRRSDRGRLPVIEASGGRASCCSRATARCAARARAAAAIRHRPASPVLVQGEAPRAISCCALSRRGQRRAARHGAASGKASTSRATRSPSS